VIREIQQNRYERIVDIGCAEGYYAVGFAKTCPDTQVFAFDAEPRELKLCLEMRNLNGAKNLSLGSFCGPDVLLKVAARYRSMIMSDCEGYELQLITEGTVAALPKADFLIELHENFRPGVTMRLESILRKTHQVKLIGFSEPKRIDYPALEQLGEGADLCLCELRDPSTQWLYAVKTN
jgi:hypothetical protein